MPPNPWGRHRAPGRFCSFSPPWAAPLASAPAPSACPLPPCRERGHRTRALGLTMAKAELVPAGREPSLPPVPKKKKGGFASLEDGGRSAVPQNGPRPRLTCLGQGQELPTPRPRDALCSQGFTGGPTMGASQRGARAPTSPPCTPAGGRAGNAGPREGPSSSGYWPGLGLNEKPQPWLGGFLFPWKREQAGNEENAAPLVSVLPNAEGSGRHFPAGRGLRSIVPIGTVAPGEASDGVS